MKRLGVYSDLVYRKDGDVVSTNRAFIRFVTSIPPRFEEVVVFGRLDPAGGRAPYALPPEGVRLVPLPFYPRVTHVRRLVGALARSRAIFVDELQRLDAVWIFGPHPLAVVFAVAARRRGVPLFLGVRQDYPQYIANRLPGRGWRWAVGAAWLLDLAFRLLARSAPTVVLGEELAAKYAGADVLATGFPLVSSRDVVDPETALARDWSGPRVRLLSVGRLDPEKNPLLLPEILRRLRERDERWTLTVAGDGPERDAVLRRAEELGVSDQLELLGEVSNGPELWELYRRSHAFLHVSFTEGLPQVLAEAAAAGLPIVATAVGGVPAAVGHGASGLLVPPADADAAVDALVRVATDPELRERLVRAALAQVGGETLEVQLDRVVAFFRDSYGATSLRAGARTLRRAR